MRGINSVQFGGNLTHDPEVRYTQKGTAVCNLSIASNRVFTVDGDKREEATFMKCVAWGKAGETIAKYLNKGDPLFVAGRLQIQEWEKDGVKRTSVEIVVQEFTFLGGGSDPKGRGEAEGSQSTEKRTVETESGNTENYDAGDPDDNIPW